MSYNNVKDINSSMENKLYFAARVVLEQLAGANFGIQSEIPVNLDYCQKLIKLFDYLERKDISKVVAEIVFSCHVCNFGLGEGIYTNKGTLITRLKKLLNDIINDAHSFKTLYPTNELIGEFRQYGVVTIDIDTVISIVRANEK